MSETLSPLKRALMALEAMEARLAASERKTKGPIAIVGMGCRVPGGGSDPEAFWKLLDSGIDAVTEVPADRWPQFESEAREATWVQAARWGGFLPDVDRFDPLFFGIAPREAVSMDPQQRLLLEVTWEAIEHAGYAPTALSGSATGVFVALCSNDYSFLHIKDREPETIDAHYGSGISHSIASGRISYLLGLRGPSLTVDTACSSSLVALHLACQSLRLGEIGMAITGGANLILTPENNVTFAKAGMLSRTGHCHTFASTADGYVRSEGCGVVVLKRLEDALADGDSVHAVLRSSAVNQDGPSAGLTAPNGLAQQEVIRRALDLAGVSPGALDYVEAHGTGTLLGDPIELRALGAVLAETASERGRPLRVGSVKTNLGHLEAAAGVVGLIKVVLAMAHETIPKHLHFEAPNPHVDWASLPIEVASEATAWPRGETPRVASVSSFGFSGTNAHVVVEEPPALELDTSETDEVRLFTVSARSEEALDTLLDRYRTFVPGTAASLDALCFTAGAGRPHWEHRAAFAASSREELSERLAARNGARGRTRVSEPARLAFLFSGQGAQYAGMGRELYEHEPVFRKSFDRSSAILERWLGRPLIEIVFPAEGSEALIDETRYTQPALFALEHALYELWRSWGVAPSVVAGHSIGEYVAATVAGLWELEDALHLVAERGRLMQSVEEPGAMVAVFASEDVVRRALEGEEARVGIAAVNGPSNVVVSGAVGGVAAVVARLEASGIESRKLQVSHAFHSPLMDPILEAFEETLASVRFKKPTLRIVSASDGDGESMGTPSYWREQLRGTVRFADALAAVGALGAEAAVELGPGATLTELGASVLPETRFVPSLRKARSDRRVMAEALARLYVSGITPDWSGLFRSRPTRAALPTYPFQRRRYWIESGSSARGSKLHPLVDRRVSSPALAGRELLTAELRPSSPDYLGDHRIRGAIVLPTTAYLEMVLAAGDAVWGEARRVLEDVVIRAPLVIEDAGTEAQVIFEPDGGGGTGFEVVSKSEGAFTVKASGRIVTPREHSARLSKPERLDDVRGRCSESVDVSRYYEGLRRLGFEYGPRFHVLESLHRRDGEALGRIELRPDSERDLARYRVHPTLLDACLQLVGPALYAPDALEEGDAFLPFSLERYEVFRKPARRLWAHASLSTSDVATTGVVRSDLALVDDAGQTVAVLENLQLARAREQDGEERLRREWLYDLEWRAVTPAPAAKHPPSGTWLLLHHGDRSLSSALAKALEGEGAKPRVEPVTGVDDLLGDELDTIVYFCGPPPREELGASELEALERKLLEGLLRVVQAIGAHPEAQIAAPRLAIVTEGAEAPDDGLPQGFAAASVLGFQRTLLIEHPELRSLVLDVEPGENDGAALMAALASSQEDRLARRAGTWLAPRLVRRSAGAATHGADAVERLEISERGVLENLAYGPMERREPKAGEVEIAIAATALNFRDVLNALGMYPGDAGALGTECAGVIARVGPGVEGLAVGDAVVAALTAETFASHVTTRATHVVRKPRRLSFEQAITIPNVFLTAYYGLVARAGMKAGDKVLIHAAAGGVGLAAVALAKRAGAEIYATAGSPRKREFLASLGVRHLFDSRSLDFAEAVRERTDGRGVDIVLNSLAGEFIPKSLSVLAPGGRFVELGRRDIWDPARVEAAVPGVSYIVFEAGDVYGDSPEMMREHLGLLMGWFERRELEPLPLRVFPVEKTVEAFRFMAQARHIGKVVVSRRSRRDVVREDVTYLVTGGHGAIGRAVAGWLLDRGASHLVLASRRGASETFALETGAARVEHVKLDVSREDDVRDLVGAIETTLGMPPLAGVFHVAGTIDDAVVSQQDWSRFERVLKPKLLGAFNLHRATKACALEHFVLFSSSAAFLGSAGQSNYSAANAFLDGLAHYRRGLGLPALSIAFGPWAGSGMASAEKLTARYQTLGLALLPKDSALEALEVLLREGATASAAQRVEWPRLSSQYKAGTPAFLSLVTGASTGPRPGSSRREGTSAGKTSFELTRRLQETPPSEQREVVARFVQARVESVLGIEGAASLEAERPLSEVGLDSLMAVELRNLLATALGRSLPATLLFKYPTVEALTEFLATEVLELVPSGAEVEEGEPESDDLDAVSALSDEEVRELLAREVEALSGDRREGDR